MTRKEIASRIFNLCRCRKKTAELMGLETVVPYLKGKPRSQPRELTDEDHDWIQYWLNPCTHNRNVLVERYLPLTRSRDEDMSQEGRIALIHQIPKYDGSTKFATYARYRVVGAMKDYGRSVDPLPRLVRKAYNKRLAFESQGIDPKSVMTPAEYEKSFPQFTSNFENLFIHAKGEARKEDIEHLCVGLDIKEKTIIYLYYVVGRTMKEVAEFLFISESRISQIHTSIIRRLKKNASVHNRTGRQAM